MKASIRIVTALTVAATILSSCHHKHDRLFYAFTDDMIDWSKLELYSDSHFRLHTSVHSYTGTYHVQNDTIFMEYEGHSEHAPDAYLINRAHHRVDELRKVDSTYIIPHPNRWIGIVENHLGEEKK